jgi:hypothetical protein
MTIRKLSACLVALAVLVPTQTARAAILYEQPFDPTSGAIISQVFPNNPNESTKSFDDVVVSSAWNISQVTIFGTERGGPTFNVSVNLTFTTTPDFFAPPVASATGVEIDGNLVFSGLDIELDPGTYWISAWVERPSDLGGQWFWDNTMTVTGSEFYLHNPGGAFGFGTDPIPRRDLDPAHPLSQDLVFRIEGELAPVPEPATLTLLGLGALGLAGCRWRRDRRERRPS